jgi:hypothetical protein
MILIKYGSGYILDNFLKTESSGRPAYIQQREVLCVSAENWELATMMKWKIWRSPFCVTMNSRVALSSDWTPSNKLMLRTTVYSVSFLQYSAEQNNWCTANQHTISILATIWVHIRSLINSRMVIAKRKKTRSVEKEERLIALISMYYVGP